MSEYTANSFKPLLVRLVQTPEYFTPDDLKLALEHIFTPDILLPAQIGAFLTALHIHKVERRPESLAAAAAVLRSRAIEVAVEDRENDFVVDIVGTGGDGYNLFNVSTTAAVVAAGAGARVIKVSPFFFRPFVHIPNTYRSMVVEPLHLPQERQIYLNPWIASSQRRPPERPCPSLVSRSHLSSHLTITPRSVCLPPTENRCHSARCSTS